MVTSTEEISAGTLTVEINLQSGDTEDEMKRNFQIKQQAINEQKAREEEERMMETRKKMQFVMEQAPVFAQLYVHIDRLGHNDNIGERTEEQIAISENVKPLDDTLNNRGDESPVRELNLPKRNLFVQFKAFPKLELLKTGTVWQ